MKPTTFRISLPSVTILAIALLVGCGGGLPVETTNVSEGPIAETFEEQAKTRLERRTLIAMPVAGVVGRLELMPGSTVRKGDRLAAIDMVPLQQRAEEAAATVRELSARVAILADDAPEKAALESAKMARAAGDMRRDVAVREWQRTEPLQVGSAVSQTQRDNVEMEARTTALSLSQLDARIVELEAGLKRRAQERAAAEGALAAAQAALVAAAHDVELAKLSAPEDSAVLERYETGGGFLPAGTPLFLLGNLNELEVETEVLSQQAINLQPGKPVEYTLSSRREPLVGEVVRIEPAGFTKRSSLGVEQQRVIVVSSIKNRPAELGFGYRVTARFTVETKDRALLVPRYSVLQAADESFYVYALEGDVMRRRPVRLGLRSDQQAEILEGLRAGEEIVATPDTALKDGARFARKK